MTIDLDKAKQISRSFVFRYELLTWVLRGVLVLTLLDMLIFVISTGPALFVQPLRFSSMSAASGVLLVIALVALGALAVIRSRWKKSYDAAKLVV